MNYFHGTDWAAAELGYILWWRGLVLFLKVGLVECNALLSVWLRICIVVDMVDWTSLLLVWLSIPSYGYMYSIFYWNLNNNN